VRPVQVGLEPNHILYSFLVVAAEKDLRVVLVLDKHLHWRLDQTGHSDAVGPAIRLEVIQPGACVVLGRIVSRRGA